MSLYRFHISLLPQILIFGGASIALTLLLRKRLIKSKGMLPWRYRVAILYAAIGAMVLVNSVKFARYALNRNYSILDSARSLERVLSQGVFLVGDCATSISLETDFRTLPSYGDLIRYDERERFEQYPITHFIIRFPTLFEYLNKNYPDLGSKLSPVRSFGLCGMEATIVRYEAWPGYQQARYRPGRYETAMSLLGRGQVSDAYQQFEASLAESPDSYEALVGMAICLANMGRTDEARDAAERALRLGPRDALGHEVYGDLLAHLGRDREARAQWEKALKLSPNSRNLQSKLGPGRRR
jgi:tetratricopeptide (TPR) repeat protein